MEKLTLISLLLILVLSTTVVAQTCPNGMVAYWRLDEKSGTVASDSYNSYDGTLTGGTWLSAKVNNGLDFDGDDYVDLGDVSELNSVSEFTIIGWIKQDSNTANERVFDKIDDGSHDISIAPYAGRIYFEVGNSANSYGYWNDYSSTIPSNTWYHLAAVYDGSAATNAERAKIYTDATQRTLSFSGTIPSTTAAITADFTLSRSGDDFNGAMDEVAIFNRALSQAEISDLMNRGIAGKGLCVVCGDGIVDTGEQCDDGNTQNGDGCSSTCQDESFCTNIVYDSGDLCLDTGYDSGTKQSDYVISIAPAASHLSTGDRCGVTGEYYIDSTPNGVITWQTPSLPVAGDYVLTYDYLVGNREDQEDEDYTVSCGTKTYTFPDLVLFDLQWRQKTVICDFNAGVNNVVFTSLDTGSVHFEGFRIYNCIDHCGDGIVSGSEQCDDGNLLNGDGCDEFCMLEGKAIPVMGNLAFALIAISLLAIALYSLRQH